MRGLKRGILGGLVLAIIIFFLPDSLLGAVTEGSGLVSLVPATAPPLGTKARLLLAAGGLLIGFALTFWVVRRRRNEWDIDDDAEFAPAEPAEPAFASTAPRPEPLTSAQSTGDSGTEARLSRVERAVAERPSVTLPSDGEAVANRLGEIEARLASLEARLADQPLEAAETRLMLRSNARVGRALAEIRRSIDAG